MSPIHLGIGAVCVAAVVGLFAWLQLRQEPTDQHFVFVNEYEDASCVMNFADGSKHRFAVKANHRYERTFKAPKIGFIIMRCETASGRREAPGHLRLVEGGGLTDAKFTPQGEIESRYYPGGRRVSGAKSTLSPHVGPRWWISLSLNPPYMTPVDNWGVHR